MQSETLYLWPTAVMTRQYEKSAAFHQALVEAVKPRELYPPLPKASGGVGYKWNRFDASGWNGNLFRELQHVPEMRELQSMFEDAAKEYICDHMDVRYKGRNVFMRAFANRYEKGQHICGHHHGAVHFVIIYYPQIGAPGTTNVSEGALMLHDPRGGIQQTTTAYGPRFEIMPKEGMLLVLPGYLYHEVGPYFGTPARISISADVLIQYADYPMYNTPFKIERAGEEGGKVHLLT